MHKGELVSEGPTPQSHNVQNRVNRRMDCLSLHTCVGKDLWTPDGDEWLTGIIIRLILYIYILSIF